MVLCAAPAWAQGTDPEKPPFQTVTVLGVTSTNALVRFGDLANHAIRVNIVAGAGAGGTSSNFVAVFPAAGTAAGFLWHNWHPATVYLGDAGAYFLGFLLAIVTLRLRPVGIALPWSALIPVLLVFVPILDTTFVTVRRLLERRHPFTPGRDHLSHVLMDRGLSVRQAVTVLQVILIASVTGAVALAWSFR